MLRGCGHTGLSMRRRACGWLLGACLALLTVLAPISFAHQGAMAAEGVQMGSVTGLRLPRYASLRFDKTNVREGPSKTHRTAWIFQRAGLPVEIIGEFDIWRRIRDSEGAEGWVLASLLSGRRAALVAPWRKAEEAQVDTYAKLAAIDRSTKEANLKYLTDRVFGEDKGRHLGREIVMML